MRNARRVLVLGGSGESGRRIVDHLARRYPEWRVTSAARRPQSVPTGPGNRRVMEFDIRDRARALATLAEHDLAIIAMGPMHAYGAEPHRLCLEAGIDCIDINDNLGVADEVLGLHEHACESGRLVLTGMGFTPGLSSLLLAKLAAQCAAPNGHYHIRVCMGAAYGGGESSPYAILSSFSRRIQVLDGGRRQVQDTPWKDAQRYFVFPGHSHPVEMIPFSALEVASQTADRNRASMAIARVDARYHIQYLKQGFARFMSSFDLGPSTLDRLARMFYASGQSMKLKKDADPDTVLWVYPDGAPQRGLLIHGVISSYDLTALMACSTVDAWAQGNLAGYQGVYTADQLAPSTCEQIAGHLARRGVSSKPADVQALQEQGLYFGWVQAVSGDEVGQLRHYGCNWYTAPPHPKMVPLQKRFLLESAVWAGLRQRCRGTGFMAFVVSTLRRWRRHYKMLADFRRRDNGPLAEKWKLVTRDISMFTSGYSRACDVLGRGEALRLYGRMFLETGRMEMRWLWPDAAVFLAFERPWRAVCDYWLAFMRGCQELGVLRYTVHDDGGRLRCEIDHCAYAEMFHLLGCPELARLVREMERDALSYMASQSGLHLEWETMECGRAKIELQPLAGS